MPTTRLVKLCALAALLYYLNTNQDLGQWLCYPQFTLALTDGARHSTPSVFSHYRYDVVRALNSLKNVRLLHPHGPFPVPRRILDASSCPGYTAFVSAAVSYLGALVSPKVLKVAMVVNVRHHLPDPDAPGNYLRMACTRYAPAASASENAERLRQAISREKRKLRRATNAKILGPMLWADVILNCWSVRDGARTLVPESELCCSTDLWDGRRRAALLSHTREHWYVRREFYFYS